MESVFVTHWSNCDHKFIRYGCFPLPVAMDLLLYSDQQQFSRDVDEKANAYFQAIYNRGMSVDRLLDILKQFKDSANKKERVSTETSSRAVLLAGENEPGQSVDCPVQICCTPAYCTKHGLTGSPWIALCNGKSTSYPNAIS